MGRTKGATNKKKNNKPTIIYPEVYEAPKEENSSPTSTDEIASASNDSNVAGTEQPAPETQGENTTGNTENITDPQAAYANVKNEFDAIINSKRAETGAAVIDEGRRPRKSKAEVAQEKYKVPGRLFALMNDRIIANGLAMFDIATSKDPSITIPSNWLYTSDKELEELAPVAAAAASEMGVDEHPTLTFYGMLISAQLSNYMRFRAEIRALKRANPDFDISMLDPNKK